MNKVMQKQVSSLCFHAKWMELEAHLFIELVILLFLNNRYKIILRTSFSKNLLMVL